MAPRSGTKYVKNLIDDITVTDDNTNNIKILNEAIRRYPDAIGYIELKKKLKKGSLLALDEYVQSLDTVDEISKEDLVKIFNWKITRGQFRPLINQINKNTNDDVKRVSREAFNEIRLKKWESGLNILSQLIGVGVATATAFFAVDKENIPFMCDEILEAITGNRDYKIKPYGVMRSELIKLGVMVNMNASDLCQALWAHAILSEYDGNYNVSKESTKRSRDTEDQNQVKRKK